MKTDADRSQPAHSEIMELPSAHGFDARDGLRRASGNARLYLDLLRQFVEGHSDAAERVLISLREGDVALAERTAHSVKGVAGNLGSTAVPAAAGELERAIRTGVPGPEIEVLRVKLASELAALTASLKPYLEKFAKDRDADDTSPADPEAVEQAVKELAPLLEDSDPAATEILDSRRAALRMLFTPEGFAEFERLVANYCFDEAAARLQSAINQRA